MVLVLTDLVPVTVRGVGPHRKEVVVRLRLIVVGVALAALHPGEEIGPRKESPEVLRLLDRRR